MKTARRRFMVPIPKVHDLSVLNERLLARCLERLDALEAGGQAAALLADLDALRDLPAVPFEACEHVPGQISSTALVRYRLVDYSAPAAHAHKKVMVKGYVDRVEIALARQLSVPSGVCRLACPEPVEGDRIAWTEAAGLKGEIRTIEAVVATRTGTPNGRNLELRAIAASGPGAPEPGSAIGRTADAVTARGCFRAPWADEARRERTLHPPEQRTEEQTREQGRDRSRDRGFSM